MRKHYTWIMNKENRNAVFKHRGRTIEIKRIKGYWVPFIDGNKLNMESIFFGNAAQHAKLTIDSEYAADDPVKHVTPL